MEFERPKSLFSPKLQIWFSSVALKTNTERTLFLIIFFRLPFSLPSFACSCFPGFYLFAESALAAQPACLPWPHHGGQAGGHWGGTAPSLPVLVVAGRTQCDTFTCELQSLLSSSGASPCSLGPVQRKGQYGCPKGAVGGRWMDRMPSGSREDFTVGEAQSWVFREVFWPPITASSIC